MVNRVEPLAHVPAFLALLFDLLLAQRLEQHEGDGSVEADSVHPDGHKSLSHDGGEVALPDVEHVGGSETACCEESGLSDTLSVVKSVDNGLVDLPFVIVHVFSSSCLTINYYSFCHKP